MIQGAAGRLNQSNANMPAYHRPQQYSIADPDLGSGAFLTTGSGIRNFFLLPDPGSSTHISESLVTTFLKFFVSRLQFFCTCLKIKLSEIM
jgi:hypothetical protein